MFPAWKQFVLGLASCVKCNPLVILFCFDHVAMKSFQNITSVHFVARLRRLWSSFSSQGPASGSWSPSVCSGLKMLPVNELMIMIGFDTLECTDIVWKGCTWCGKGSPPTKKQQETTSQNDTSLEAPVCYIGAGCFRPSQSCLHACGSFLRRFERYWAAFVHKGTVNKWRQPNFPDFWPPLSPCQHFGPIYSTKITQPPLLSQNFIKVISIESWSHKDHIKLIPVLGNSLYLVSLAMLTKGPHLKIWKPYTGPAAELLTWSIL